MSPFQLGTAVSRPGELVYGQFDLLQDPVGTADRLPVILAQGMQAGPVLWLTAGIHGGEHSGIQLIHRLMTPELVRDLCGTIVAIPALCPSGLRASSRTAYSIEDPNRIFPETSEKPDPEDEPLPALEESYSRFYDAIRETANFYVDVHSAPIGSMSWVIRDRVLYRAGDDAERRAAEDLSCRIDEMCRAYGHTTVNELPPAKYLQHKLHRSSTGAAVNLARIPAITLELGGGLMPDEAIVAAGVVGMRNLLRWAGMLPKSPEPITGISVYNPGYPCRRLSLRVPQACVIRHLVKPGDVVRRGAPLCEMRDIWGRPVGSGVLNSEYDGWVIHHWPGIVYYSGAQLSTMAVHDNSPKVVPYTPGQALAA